MNKLDLDLERRKIKAEITLSAIMAVFMIATFTISITTRARPATFLFLLVALGYFTLMYVNIKKMIKRYQS